MSPGPQENLFMKMEKKTFSVDFKGTKLIGDTLPLGSRPSWLFLHGAGQADRTRFEKLRQLFLGGNIPSCAFDYIGHGETGGDIYSTSLSSRTDQTRAVIESQNLHAPLSIVAASMSGYTAIQLTTFYEIQNLVLLAPAVYTSKANSLLFSPQFTEVIREAQSWQKSDAWEILRQYKGSLLIFAGGHDQVVPREVVEKLYRSAEQANIKEIITVKDANHPLGKWLDEHPEDLNLVFSTIVKTLPIHSS